MKTRKACSFLIALPIQSQLLQHQIAGVKYLLDRSVGILLFELHLTLVSLYLNTKVLKY